MSKQVNQAISHYATVRDTIAAKEKEFKAWKADQKTVLDKLELYLRAAMSELDLTKVSNTTHTAFETTKDSVVIEDKTAFSVFLVQKMLLFMQPGKYLDNSKKWYVTDGEQIDGKERLKEDVQLVLSSGTFDLLTLSANKNNCKAYRTDHDNTMPVGVKYATEKVIQIRKS